jgi:hypothetical protein
MFDWEVIGNDKDNGDHTIVLASCTCDEQVCKSYPKPPAGLFLKWCTKEIDPSIRRQSQLYLLALRIIVIDLDTLEPFHASSWPSPSLPSTLIV